ncbi:MAG: 3',5'-cyclic-nucleotide phosphodiesterase [Oligoflexia bacterium]|nr:3',5'-cyclic-nucleotide phosphodiesterase [Oligoflexia bacterium]
MIVRVIGGHGGVSPGYKVTSYLVDGQLLIDAGSVAEGIMIEEQIKIDYILLSHSHLDHIKDIAFLCDNCFGHRQKPFEVYADDEVKKAITTHLMNDIIWPDFSKLPNKNNPTIRFFGTHPEKAVQLEDFNILPVPVNHPCNSMGFILEKKDKAIVFTQDTGPTERIWELAKGYKNLKAIFTEVSFPNFMQKIATNSFHHTPNSIKEEIKKMPKDVPIFVGHLKPNFQTLLYKEIGEIGNDRIVVLGSDDQSYLL